MARSSSMVGSQDLFLLQDGERRGFVLYQLAEPVFLDPEDQGGPW